MVCYNFQPSAKPPLVGFLMTDLSDLLLTEDLNRYPGYQMPLWHNPLEDCSSHRGLGRRFRMVLIERGSGVLRVGPWRGAFIAPVVFCLGETEQPEVSERRGLRAQSVYFHPSVVNQIFDFIIIRKGGEGLSVSESQDLKIFAPFIHRSPGVFRPVILGPSSARRISELMTAIGGILRARSDAVWPCRSRSYFLELLLVVERAFNDPSLKDMDSLGEPAQGADSVIMYLHANYHQKITLADLARRFHTNRTTLAKQFCQLTGHSVLSYLTQLRMNVAASILRDTELDIGEIMQRVGFRDNTHFGRTFRRYNGCTPSEYRRTNCWMLRKESQSMNFQFVESAGDDLLV
jgi:AraC-like DNA-binding protein